MEIICILRSACTRYGTVMTFFNAISIVRLRSRTTAFIFSYSSLCTTLLVLFTRIILQKTSCFHCHPALEHPHRVQTFDHLLREYILSASAHSYCRLSISFHPVKLTYPPYAFNVIVSRRLLLPYKFSHIDQIDTKGSRLLYVSERTTSI